jgi:hypothetical protein
MPADHLPVLNRRKTLRETRYRTFLRRCCHYPILLIKATWSRAFVSNGTKDDYLTAIAHGRAAGIKITSVDDGKFTKEDWIKIGVMAAQLRPLYEPQPGQPGPQPRSNPASAPAA